MFPDDKRGWFKSGEPHTFYFSSPFGCYNRKKVPSSRF